MTCDLTLLPNRFPSSCCRCGERVAAGEGYSVILPRALIKDWNGGFFVQSLRDHFFVEHKDCHVLFEGTSRHWKFAPND